MRKIVIILFILFFYNYNFAQIVDIPDANFKNALVNTLCVAPSYFDPPLWDADVNNDGEIQVSEAEAVVHLFVGFQDITSLQGIEAFTGLKSLSCTGNQITGLDMSNSPALEYLSCGISILTLLNITQNSNLLYLNCSASNLTEIDVTQNINLEELILYNNAIQDIDLSQNTNLIKLEISKNELNNIDVSQNISLTSFYVEHNNLSEINILQNTYLADLSIGDNNISNLDISNNPDLKVLTCNNNPLTGELDLSHLNAGMYFLLCYNTLLSSLNIKNGDNINLTRMWAQDNPNLTCIQVDDAIYANNTYCDINGGSGWCKDETASYSEDCNLSIGDVLEKQITLYPNPVKDVIMLINNSNYEITSVKVYDSLGKLVLHQTNLDNQLDVSNLSIGLLIVQIETNGGTLIKKVLKE